MSTSAPVQDVTTARDASMTGASSGSAEKSGKEASEAPVTGQNASTSASHHASVIEKGRVITDPWTKYVSGRARGVMMRIKRFTPSWYSVVMGTGICNTLLFLMPWESTHAAFQGIGAGFLLIGIVLCILFSIITVTRYIVWPEILPVLLRHETHSLYLGCIPMGYVTLISGIAFTGNAYNVPHAVIVGAGLWWLALGMSLLSAGIVPFCMFTQHNATAQGLSALWLLPVVPCITMAASGGVFAELLTPINPHYALTILLASYVMNGIGLLLAILIFALYLQRLAIYHLPPREIIISCLLPLGPCGQGGYALIRCGQAAQGLFPILAQQFPDREAYVALSSLGSPMFGAGIVLGLLLWGLGMWWAFIACASLVTVFYDGGRISVGQFTLGFWGSTFPVGSLGLLTFGLGEVFDSMFFNVVGTILTVIVLLMWFLCMVPTTMGFIRGSLFQAPCLTKLSSETSSVNTPERGRSKEPLRRDASPR